VYVSIVFTSLFVFDSKAQTEQTEKPTDERQDA